MRALRKACACSTPLLASSRDGARCFEPQSLQKLRLLSAATAESGGRQLVAACVLERLPIVLPTEPAWETEYQEWRYNKRLPFYKVLPTELTEPKTDADSNTAKSSWAPAQVSSSADTDLRSIERKMQHFVYLVVRRNGVWQFLEAAHSSGETIRQTGERALSSSVDGLDVHFTGNAPAAHHMTEDGRTTRFLMRAQLLGGDVQPLDASGITDWAWVTKDEVPDFLGPDMEALVAKAF